MCLEGCRKSHRAWSSEWVSVVTNAMQARCKHGANGHEKMLRLIKEKCDSRLESKSEERWSAIDMRDEYVKVDQNIAGKVKWYARATSLVC